MPDRKSLATEILIHVAQTLNVPMRGLVSTIELLDEGGTVPFIARYRKEATGNLDEVQIRDIEEKLATSATCRPPRDDPRLHREQGKLTPELKARIEATLEKSELEDLYLPFRPKRRTKATIAREKGLEPLALYIWAQQPDPRLWSNCRAPGRPEKGVATMEEALEGARHIVAETISEDADIRKALRKLMFDEGVVASRRGDRRRRRAGKVQNVLRVQRAGEAPFRPIACWPSAEARARRCSISSSISNRRAPSGSSLPDIVESRATGRRNSRLAIEDCWKRLLNSSIQTEIRLELKKRSDTDAIQVFRENLHNLLLAPPAGPSRVLGIDPGIRTGCKIAVVDETGKFLGQRCHLSASAQERRSGFRPHAEDAHGQASGPRHRHRQRHRLARDRCLRARLPSPGIAGSGLLASRSANPGRPSIPPPTWPGRNSPNLTLRFAALFPSPAGFRIRWPSW